jgi:shikimate kinase
MNIVLIGYRSSGKPSVGKILAEELGRDFLDTDRLIETRTGSPK